MKNILLTFFIILTFVFIGSFGYQAYLSNRYVMPSKEVLAASASSVKFPQKVFRERSLSDLQPTSSSSIKFNGWIPTWASKAGVASFEENAEKFETISPVIYAIPETGDIQVNKIGLEEIRNIASSRNVKIVPTISSFNAESLSLRLKDLDNYHKFLFQEIEQNNFDGIDLNYEETFTTDKEAFFNHLKALKEYLSGKNKMLSVTVLSKWGDFTYGFAPQTRGVQDYTEIGKIADQVRIMAYDFTSSGSANPGPVAPTDWVEQVLTYATNRIPASKIVLGIPLYGYFWGYGETGARALDYKLIQEIINANQNPDTFYSEKHGESVLKYIGSNGKAFFGYHASPESVKERIDLAAKYGLKSVVFWRLGNDPL